MPVEIIQLPAFARNRAQQRNIEADHYCVKCGRKVNPDTAYWVRCGGGGMFAMPDEEAAANPASDMGCWPIGPDCIKKQPELIPLASPPSTGL